MTADSREQIVRELSAAKIIAVIRLRQTDQLLRAVEALVAGGLRCVEITMTVPRAADMIEEMARRFGDDVLPGAGTVTETADVGRTVDAGARFVVSPVYVPEIVRAAHERGTVAIPGCFTPTEAFTAWRAGADIVKIFPAGVLGPRYFRDLRGPFPDIRLMPTGGVTAANALDWLEAGACVVGIGSDLVDPSLIAAGRFEDIESAARHLMHTLAT